MNTLNDKRTALLRHPYIHVANGGRLYVEGTRPDMIDIKSIAYGLAKECRFAGQSEGFYSVAQHSVLMRDYALLHALCPKDQLIYILLHDAAEGYIGDIAKPIKVTLPDFNQIEDRVLEQICMHFGLALDFPPIVKQLDNRILVDEASQLFDGIPDWVQDFHDIGIQPLGIQIRPWTWEESLYYFAEAFCEDYTAFLAGKGIITCEGYAHFKWDTWEGLMETAHQQFSHQRENTYERSRNDAV